MMYRSPGSFHNTVNDKQRFAVKKILKVWGTQITNQDGGLTLFANSIKTYLAKNEINQNITTSYYSQVNERVEHLIFYMTQALAKLTSKPAS